MKTILSLVLSMMWITLSVGQTQLELDNKAKEVYQKADRELNTVYNKIMQDYKQDKTFLNNMKKAQRLWILFREAQLIMKYPSFSKNLGSISQMCRYYYLTDLTLARTKELEKWLDGVEEGDVCSGTIRIK